MSTRTIEECQEIVRRWKAGDKEWVIGELGGEPSDKFLADFKPPGASKRGGRKRVEAEIADLLR